MANVFDVEKILRHKEGYFSNLYLVKWSGYSSRHNSWEPEEHFKPEDIQEYMDQFEQNRNRRISAAEKRKRFLAERENEEQQKRTMEAIKREERIKRRNAKRIENDDDCKSVSSTHMETSCDI